MNITSFLIMALILFIAAAFVGLIIRLHEIGLRGAEVIAGTLIVGYELVYFPLYGQMKYMRNHKGEIIKIIVSDEKDKKKAKVRYERLKRMWGPRLERKIYVGYIRYIMVDYDEFINELFAALKCFFDEIRVKKPDIKAMYKSKMRIQQVIVKPFYDSDEVDELVMV